MGRLTEWLNAAGKVVRTAAALLVIGVLAWSVADPAGFSEWAKAIGLLPSQMLQLIVTVAAGW
jgi:hypothetical protein